MEIIKTKINHEWVNGELIEKDLERIEVAVFTNKEGEKIIGLNDLSFLVPVSVNTLKNFIRNKHVLHYNIGQEWFVNLDDLFEKGKRVLQ